MEFNSKIKAILKKLPFWVIVTIFKIIKSRMKSKINICFTNKMLKLLKGTYKKQIIAANNTNCLYYLVQNFMVLCQCYSCLGQMKSDKYRYALGTKNIKNDTNKIGEAFNIHV